ncbi:MAG: hypothetical protein JRI68_33255, partial [Deltaproteobacteria bacterium]|nr:hypothetical protein [Deltaproteobacteria bacterium]
MTSPNEAESAPHPMKAQREPSPTPATASPPPWRKWALTAGLYLFVIAVAAGMDGALVLPAVLIAGVAFLAYEVLHPGHRWRHPAGAVVSVVLLVPTVFVVGYGSWWLVAAMVGPAMVLLVARVAGPKPLIRWWARRAELGSLLYLGAVAILIAWGNGRVTPPLNDDVLFTLYAAPQTFRLTQPEIKAAAATVQRALETHEPGAADAVPESLRAQADALPEVLRGQHGRDVYVTLWLDDRPFVRGSAKGGLLYEDLVRATSRALGQAEDVGQWVERAQDVRLMVDVADPPVRIGSRPSHKLFVAAITLLSQVGQRTLRASRWLSQLSYEIEPGIDGVLLRAGDRTAGFLPADPVIRGWLSPRVRGRIGKIERLMTEMSREAGGPDNLWQRSDAVLYKVRSFSFGRPAASTGQQAQRLYRANALLDSVDSAAILEGIAEVARWLAVAVGPDGKFDYEYLPNHDGTTQDYNVVRHAGCVYGLFHVYRMALREPRLRPHANDYLEAGIRSMSWVYRDLGKPRGATDDQMIAFLGPGGVATSGASALTLLTFLARPRPDMVSHPVLAERLERSGDAERIEGLGRFLVAMIDDHGKVFANYQDRLAAPEVDKEPLYYPGETMLALARLHNATRDPRWLEAARRIADHRVASYNRDLRNPDHWVMQGLWELYRSTGEERYALCGLRMGQHHAAEQFPPLRPPFEDYAGSYRRTDDTPRTTRACSRSEALGGVVHIAWRKGVDATIYEDALIRGAEHLLENTYNPANSFYLPNPAKARGAIRMGLVDNHCRIDNNQHALVGLHR